MIFKQIDSKQEWNNFIISNTVNGLLQSWQWGEFQRAYGRKVWRMALVENNKIIIGWQLIEMPLPLGYKYFYIPRPISNLKLKINLHPELRSRESQKLLFGKTKELAKRENMVFIRIDLSESADLTSYGFRKINMAVQPQEELIIDITKPEEQILSEMKQKTRYNIRLAKKHNIKIFNFSSWRRSPEERQFSISNELFNEFWRLIQATSKRQAVKPHPKEYYGKMIEVLSQDKTAEVFIAKYNGKIIAAALITFFNKIATYLHGGSDNDFRQYMAPYLLHWQLILEAKKRGFSFYNFGGVSSTKKNWAGVTRFKTGFSPQTEFRKYAGVWEWGSREDWYLLYNISRKLKRI